MSRQEFTKAVKREAFLRANGCCEEPGCGKKLAHGEAEYHHIIEAFLGGEATLDNCRVLCRKHHAAITEARHPEIDKTRRIADKLMGIKRKSRPMDGSKGSPFRKRMDGRVELR